jgi:hypothetical protein
VYRIQQQQRRRRRRISLDRDWLCIPPAMRRGGGAGGVDYAQEGRELLASVNLKLDSAPARYADSNPIYQSPETGATLYVGNATCANSSEKLAAINVKRIVFCQQPGEGKMSFRKDPSFTYLV